MYVNNRVGNSIKRDSLVVFHRLVFLIFFQSAMDSVWEVDLNLLDADSNVFKPDLIETMRKYFTG